MTSGIPASLSPDQIWVITSIMTEESGGKGDGGARCGARAARGRGSMTGGDHPISTGSGPTGGCCLQLRTVFGTGRAQSGAAEAVESGTLRQLNRGAPAG